MNLKATVYSISSPGNSLFILDDPNPILSPQFSSIMKTEIAEWLAELVNKDRAPHDEPIGPTQ